MNIEVQARHSDPETSHEAAALLNEKRGKIKASIKTVLDILQHDGPSSDFHIHRWWECFSGAPPSSPGLPRMARLWAQREGLVVHAGYGVHKGRRCRTWQLGTGTPVAPKESPLRVARRRIAELEAEVERLKEEIRSVERFNSGRLL